MRDKRRRWDSITEEDPLAGLVNLFDLWMVFSIALLLALVGVSQLSERLSQRSAVKERPNDGSVPNVPSEKSNRLENLRISHDKATGEGERLGTAYRLKSGEVIYVPD